MPWPRGRCPEPARKHPGFGDITAKPWQAHPFLDCLTTWHGHSVPVTRGPQRRSVDVTKSRNLRFTYTTVGRLLDPQGRQDFGKSFTDWFVRHTPAGHAGVSLRRCPHHPDPVMSSMSCSLPDSISCAGNASPVCPNSVGDPTVAVPYPQPLRGSRTGEALNPDLRQRPMRRTPPAPIPAAESKPRRLAKGSGWPHAVKTAGVCAMVFVLAVAAVLAWGGVPVATQEPAPSASIWICRLVCTWTPACMMYKCEIRPPRFAPPNWQSQHGNRSTCPSLPRLSRSMGIPGYR